MPPRKDAVPSTAAETDPTQRDRHLQLITKHGRMAWQKATEVAIAVRVLNRMLELGRPESVRIA